METRVLMGNEAMARGLVEAGVQVVSSYPGTPSSEILPGVVKFTQELDLPIYIEWSVNEKVAFEVALAASLTGKRSAVIMKQVGLNVAADPLMSSVYTGVRGGFIVITTDDPGPFSSQTEQDSRFWGPFAKAPVFDPSSPEEAKDMIGKAFEISERFEIPVIFRPVLRVCHARQTVELRQPVRDERPADFQKNPQRWAATPRFRASLHKKLNLALEEIRKTLEGDETLNYILHNEAESDTGIIAAGIHFAILADLLEEHGVEVPVLKISTPYPFPDNLVHEFASRFSKVLVLEATEPIIEIRVRGTGQIFGRVDGTVPKEGEPTPQNTLAALRKAMPGRFGEPDPTDETVAKAVAAAELPVRRPTLCPGCPHRSAFYAIRRTFPKGIYTSDIGCYTLGTNLGAVDTVLDMGASVGMAVGFYHAYRQDGVDKPIIATIGDSTFYHAGIPPLVNAVYTDARFVLVILDNSITAMTGMQPTPGLGILADGSQGQVVPLEGLVKGAGVTFLKVVDPYDLEATRNVLKDAHAHTRKDDGGVAVVIARHPCLLQYRKAHVQRGAVVVSDDCTGCWHCLDRFECPAMGKDEAGEKAVIDAKLCSECGVCVDVCPRHAIVFSAGE